MSEAASRTLEAEGKLDELAATRWIARRARRLRSELDDPLDLLDVDDVEAERASARRVDTLATVLAAQAQQRLRLPELGPREVAREQALHEDADLLAALSSFGNHPIWISHRVASLVLGVVVVIDRALARSLAGVGLDQLALDVDPHQLAVAAHVGDRLRIHVARRHGVQRLLEHHAVIGVDLGVGVPRGRIEARLHEREQRAALVRLEHLERPASRRAVHALPRDLEHPADRLTLHVLEVEPLLAAEARVP